MRSVATIDGVPVYSDKNIASINGARITFSDGSWCDVRTKQVVNRGDGFISIGEEPAGVEGAKRETRGPTSYSGIRRVECVGVFAKVVIEPGAGLETTVEMQGVKSDLDAIAVNQWSGVLVIKANSDQSSPSSMSVAGFQVSGGSVKIGGISFHGGVNIQNVQVVGHGQTGVQIGGSSVEDTIIKIKVPKGTELKIDHVNGEVVIGDTLGDVNVNSNSVSNVQIGKVTNLDVARSGVGSVHVEEVTGTISVNCSGVGRVDIRSGNVTQLVLMQSGFGDFCFSGRADSAIINSSGVGSVDVAHVERKPRIQQSGLGRVRVGNWS